MSHFNKTGTVAAGSATIKIPANTQRVAVAVEGSGGTMDVSYRIAEDANAIDIDWSEGQIADAAIGSTVIDAEVTSIKITGTGKYNLMGF